MTQVRWTRQALDDLLSIREFIARDSPTYARHVVERLYEATGQLAEFPESGPEAGDVGRVVFCYGSGEAFEVEFLAGDGSTLALQTLEQDRSRPLEGTDIFRVRRDSAV